MNKNTKVVLQLLAILAITVAIALSSPFNPWVEGTFTQIQSEILDIAKSVRDGFLAYVELDGNYGPVVYEFYGLGFLATQSNIVHFIMEFVVLFASVLFIYKTAKLYTSELFALVSTIILTVFGWGSLTHAGAEELMFFIFSLTAYHVARQLKFGFLSYHTYLLAIDLGLVFFLQPGYTILWIILIVFFAVKFKIDGIDGKEYRAYFLSLLEGLLTVGAPMALYLWYFKNASAFLEKVVVYNFNNIGSFGAGLKLVCGTPWILLLAAFVIVITIKAFNGAEIADLCCWLGFMVASIMVIAMQGDNLQSFVTLSKVIYIVPLASIFSLVDKPLGLTTEERKF